MFRFNPLGTHSKRVKNQVNSTLRRQLVFCFLCNKLRSLINSFTSSNRLQAVHEKQKSRGKQTRELDNFTGIFYVKLRGMNTSIHEHCHHVFGLSSDNIQRTFQSDQLTRRLLTQYLTLNSAGMLEWLPIHESKVYQDTPNTTVRLVQTNTSIDE